jgi:hypothetical protein
MRALAWPLLATLPSIVAIACGGGGSHSDGGGGSDGAACATTCQPWQQCMSGRCALDPASHWDLVAVSASIAPLRPDGMSWDPPNGLPDPYVACGLQGQGQGRTQTVTDSLAPQWNMVICPDLTAAQLMSADLQLLVVDDDSPSADFIGGLSGLREDWFGAGPTTAGLFNIDGMMVTSTLTFELRPH